MEHATRRSISAVWADLVSARDEARLQLDLLSKEARVRWSALETKLETIEEKLVNEGEHVAEQSLSRLHEARDSVKAFVADHLPPPGMLSEYAGDVMTERAHTCRPGDSLRHAVELMRNEGCGMVPVTDDEGRLLGVITDRDVCMAVYEGEATLRNVTVEDAMTRDVRTCGPEQSLADVLDAMATARVRRIPITSIASGHLLGVVSLADVVRRMYDLGKTTAGREAACNRLARTIAAISQGAESH